MNIIPATREHLAKLYAVPPANTVRAVAVAEGDQVVAVGGIYWSDGHPVLFMRATDEARSKHPKTLTKAAKRVVSWLSGMAYAHCDSDIEAAPRFLAHLGFEHVKDTLWQRPFSR